MACSFITVIYSKHFVSVAIVYCRLEVNKMVSDLSRTMQQQLEAQKNADKESRNKELKTLEEFKRKVGFS